MTCEETCIQAYLDGELSREERKELARHLETCAPCRTLLSELKRLESWVDDALHDAYPPVAEAPIDVDRAWAAFEARLLAQDEGLLTNGESRASARMQEAPPATKSTLGRWSTMAKTYQKWLAGAAVVAVMTSTLMIPQVKAATTDFLHLFRVENIQMLEVSPQDLQDVKNFLDSGKLGQRDLNGLGKLTVDGDQKAKPQHFASAEEAKQAGFDTVAVPKGAHVTGINVEPGHTVHLQLDVTKVNALLEQLGTDTKFAANLDQKPFAITSPLMIDTTFTTADVPNVTFSYGVAESPKLQAPADVDLVQLRETVLGLPFLPEHIRQQLASIDDWQTTLPVPHLTGESNGQKTTVNGSNGLFLQANNGHRGTLIWQKNGYLRQLSATITDGSVQDLQNMLQNAALTWK